MTDDGCIIVGAQGVSAIDGGKMEQMMADGKRKLERYSFDEKNAQVQFVNDDVAIVAYKVNERVADGKTLRSMPTTRRPARGRNGLRTAYGILAGIRMAETRTGRE
jgi:hypothetical protein